MSLSSGFFNSIEHDRRYDARDFSRIFDGIINDGIFMNIGDHFVVKAQSNNGVSTNRVEVGSGRAWFNGTWTRNTTIYVLTLPPSDVVTKRIDAVVLEVDARDETRQNSLKIVSGKAAANPEPPQLARTETFAQYPLAYVTRLANIETVTQSSIRNMVGSDDTPFVTGILETVSLTDLLGQWEGELNDFMNGIETDFSQWAAKQMDEYEKWQNGQQTDFEKWAAEAKEKYGEMLGLNEEDFDKWLAGMNSMFSEWFSQIKDVLDENAAAKLQLQINSDEIKRILTAGFEDGVKTISEDGREITTVATDGRSLEKVFNDDFSILTSTLKASGGATIATQTKEFDSTGSVIKTTVVYT